MESLLIELISNASAQLFPLSSPTNFLVEQLKLKSQREFAISAKVLPVIVTECHREE